MHPAIPALLLLLGSALPAAAQGDGGAKAPLASTQCPDTMEAYAGTDTVLPCACPAELTGQGQVEGTDTYTAGSATCRAALHAGMISRRGGPVVVEMLPGAARHPGTTRNGVTSANAAAADSSYRFQGEPLQAAAPTPPAPTVMSQCPDNMSAFADSAEVVRCGCPAVQTGQGSIWGTDTYTADSATCRAALHAGMIPRQGGQVTLEMLPGQPRYPGTTRNGVTSSNFGNYAASFRFQGEPVARASQPAAGAPAQCPDDMTAYADSDEVVSCTCPAPRSGQGSIWGTDTYTADSATCSAALHAGMIPRQGGPVTIEMRPGEPRYPGTTRNGIASNNFGPYGASYRFRGEAPKRQASVPLGGSQLCPDNLSAYAGSDEALTCLCPGEATLRGSIWGTDSYTADSAACRAAVHAGVIAVTGGTVSLRMLPGAPRYPGTTRNGIASSNYGPYEAGFRFEGGQRASAPVQAPVGESLRRTGQVQLYITFRTNSADLDIGAAPVLSELRDALVADAGLRLRLTGHTDNTGKPVINGPLSQRRADSVRQWLVAAGVAPARLTTAGKGPDEPIADNATEAGRALNRRVQARVE